MTRKLLKSVVSWPSHYLFLVGFLVGGVVLCGGSAALHIADFKAPDRFPHSCVCGGPCVERQVGYWWAPNWSLTYAILGPLALFLMIEALKGIRAALDHLFDNEMVRDEKMVPIHEHLSSAAWFVGTRVRSGMLLVCAGLVPAGIAYSEWWNNNYLRLMAGSCADCHLSDGDWGLAGIIPKAGDLLFRRENAVFDFLTFTCEALLLGATILFFLYMLDISQVLPSLAPQENEPNGPESAPPEAPEGRVNARLLPNLRSNDPRRGFQKFEKPLQLMLTSALTFYLICYSMHINRVYMRSAGFTSIGAFIQTDVLGIVDSIPTGASKSETSGASKSETPAKWSAPLRFLFGMEPSEWEHQDYFGDAALILISFFSVIVISETVGRAASRAREDALEYYEQPSAKSLFGLGVTVEKARADKMTTWPLEWRYLQLTSLAGWMFVALVSLYFYRLGLYVFVLTLATILMRLRKAAGD